MRPHHGAFQGVALLDVQKRQVRGAISEHPSPHPTRGRPPKCYGPGRGVWYRDRFERPLQWPPVFRGRRRQTRNLGNRVLRLNLFHSLRVPQHGKRFVPHTSARRKQVRRGHRERDVRLDVFYQLTHLFYLKTGVPEPGRPRVRPPQTQRGCWTEKNALLHECLARNRLPSSRPFNDIRVEPQRHGPRGAVRAFVPMRVAPDL